MPGHLLAAFRRIRSLVFDNADSVNYLLAFVSILPHKAKLT